MSVESIREVVEHYGTTFQNIWHSGNVQLLDQVLADDFISHGAMQPPDGEGLKHFLPVFLTAFPDLQLTVEDLVVDDDKAAIRIVARGTH